MNKIDECKIVTIGGGTGGPPVLRALTAMGFNHIDAICTAMDSGGRTGTIRSDERDQVIAVSDVLRSLLALMPRTYGVASRTQAFEQVMQCIDSRSRNLGYLIYYALLDKFRGNYPEIQQVFEELMDIKFAGVAHPVTVESTTLCFETESGTVHKGEHELDRYAMSTDMVMRIWLEPKVVATQGATRAVRAATHLIYCPGSLYGSILVNFQPERMMDALHSSPAKKILISNLVSTRNETHEFTPMKYWRLFQEHTQLDHPFDIMVVPHLSRAEFERQYPRVVQAYAREHAHFLGWTDEELQPVRDKGVTVVRLDHFSITPRYHRLRHEPEKLQDGLRTLITEMNSVSHPVSRIPVGQDQFQAPGILLP